MGHLFVSYGALNLAFAIFLSFYPSPNTGSIPSCCGLPPAKSFPQAPTTCVFPCLKQISGQPDSFLFKLVQTSASGTLLRPPHSFKRDPSPSLDLSRSVNPDPPSAHPHPCRVGARPNREAASVAARAAAETKELRSPSGAGPQSFPAICFFPVCFTLRIFFVFHFS